MPNMHRSRRYEFKTPSSGLLARLGFCGVLITLALACGVCTRAAAQDPPTTPEAPKPMPADADPSYEVATIKPNNPDNKNLGLELHGGHLGIENMTIDSMLNLAYAVHPKQIIDSPAWFTSAHYDIEGVLDTDGQPNLKQIQGIMQKLLADRFQLKFHRETRELSVYAITVTKGGPKLTKSQGDPKALGVENDRVRAGQDTMTVTNLSMAEFALILQFYTERPVVDQTGLAGKWDFKWTWTSDESRLPPDATNAAPGLFTAIQEQLGLKLEAKRAPADVFVVDHVERPSSN